MDKKEEILDAAYFYFCRRGYGVSMSDIAKQVKIKTPSLYSHFKSKDEILLLTIKREIEKYNEFLDQLYSNLKVDQLPTTLHNIFDEVMHYFKANDKLRFWRNILLIDQEDLRKECSQLVLALEMGHVGRLEGLIKKLKADQSDCEGDALHFLALIQASMEIELLFYESDQEADRFIHKLWQNYSKNI